MGIKPYDPNDVGDYLRWLRELALLGIKCMEDLGMSSSTADQIREDVEGVTNTLRTLI